MFADRAKIYIKSGKGGDGHVSFRRELYVPNGGPDGGDGGKGGDVIFEVEEGLNTLTDFRHKRKYVAQPGEAGGKRNKHGKNAPDLIIKVPRGTILKEENTGKIIADMSGDNTRVTILKGGKGGRGNQNFATPTMQVPQYASPGGKSKELNILMELKVIADVGLVGFPNVGKSTLLSRVSNATPKIGNYHFTTINPNLGVVDLSPGVSFVIADIPGLIEGASQGTGLGLEFLKHIERTKVLIHIVDSAGTEGRDPISDINIINKELLEYNPELLKRPCVIAANKMDAVLEDEAEVLKLLKNKFEPSGIQVFPISAVSGEGVKELLYHVYNLLQETDPSPVVFESEYDPNEFLDDVTQPYSVEKIKESLYSIEGPRIDRMLGYTNLDDEKGFLFFQEFMKKNGILNELEDLGIQDGDTVKIYGHEFEYFK